MPSPNEQTPLARREHHVSGFVPPRPTPLSRALRLALTVMSDGVRSALLQPQSFKNAASPDRSCPTDRLAIMIDDCCAALSLSELSPEQRLEQALALPRTMEAHIRARLAPAQTMSVKEHGLRVSRTDAHEDVTLAEYLAFPNDPAIALRAADMADREAREKIGFAAHVRAFFHLKPRGSAA